LGNLFWTDYVGVGGGVMLAWWFLFVQIRMLEQDDWRWGAAAHWLPVLSQLWFSIRQPHRAPATVIIGAAGFLIVAAVLRWR
jgi:hypothetical protein